MKKIDRELQDISIKCLECKKRFTLTVSEQRFYIERELVVPKRCKKCRTKRKLLTLR